MKLNTGILVGSFLFALSSCQNFLEVESKHAISDNAVITDKVSAQTAINGGFRSLGSSGYYGGTYVTLGYFAGGDVTYNMVGGGRDLVSAKIRADDGLFISAWSNIYNTINRVNHVIQKVPAVNDPLLTDALRNEILGEAHFIRALAYFDLGRAWGGVPIKLLPTEDLSSSNTYPRNTLDETYQQVALDLNTAEELLPNGINRVRATKNTVRALRARLLLYEKKWALAEAEASKLISTTGYTLLTPFSSWFKNSIGTQETIFEIQYSAQNLNSLRTGMQHSTKGGTHLYQPTDQVVRLLNNPAIGGLPTGRRSLIGNVTQAGVTLWYGDLYFRSPATDPSFVLRIAEQYLIRAEARAHTGNLSGALEDVNKIRERAGLTLYHASELNAADKLLLAIEEERRFEFLWEGHRWFDLVRTGRAKVVLEALDANRDIQPYKYLFPIPIDEVVIGKLKQNPEY